MSFISIGVIWIYLVADTVYTILSERLLIQVDTEVALQKLLMQIPIYGVYYQKSFMIIDEVDSISDRVIHIFNVGFILNIANKLIEKLLNDSVKINED